MAGRLETQDRVTRGLSYRVCGEIADPPDGPDDPGLPPGVKVIDLLRSRLHLTAGEVRRRMKVAARIRPRRSLTGPPRPPELPALAAAVRGRCGRGGPHPGGVHRPGPAAARRVAGRPGHRRADPGRPCPTQDAVFVATGRAQAGRGAQPRRRLRREGPGQPPRPGAGPAGRGRHVETVRVLDPDRAGGVRSRRRRRPPRPPPARQRPARRRRRHRHPHQIPAAARRVRSGGWAPRWPPGRLGTHRGLPVTVIATTTLAELEAAAAAAADPSLPMPAPARTGGGSVLPMRDLITLAAGRASTTWRCSRTTPPDRSTSGRSRRLASPDQRIFCHARDHGCTHPDCAEPGYHCEVNHAVDWAHGGPHRRRQPVLRLRAIQPGRRRRHLHHQCHRPRPTGLDRRHRPTPNQPTTPPRRTPRPSRRPPRRGRPLSTPSRRMP